jgi:hypothetical protein
MKTIYKGDDRYEKIKEQMDLLSITDVTTERQVLNGTIVWELPIQSRYDSTRYLQYGSFASGYVRNQGVECHSNYQINKRYMGEYEYYPDYKWCDKTKQSIKTGKFNRFQSKKCVPIPIEIDRLEYMMNYIIKNEFVKRANSIVKGGEYLPKWQFDQASKYCDLSEERYKDLENKLATIKRISTYE